jgi:carboxyl-terminal processing protease
VEIDGIPVKRYAAERVAPYASSSTEQDRNVRTYSYQLLSGAADVPVKLSLISADGIRRDATLQRSGYKDLRKAPAFEFKILANGVAYIALDNFESDAGVIAFEKALPAILQAKALIIDVRNNGGGSTGFGHAILRHLTNQPIQGAASYVRSDNVLIRAQRGATVRWQRLDSDEPQMTRNDKVFEGPVAVLAGPRTFSAAEDFLVAYDMLGRGIIVGEPTGGSTGQPLSFALPGGGQARICIKRDTYRDGRAFVGKGVMPTLMERPNVQAIRAGQDPVLAKALAALSGQMK